MNKPKSKPGLFSLIRKIFLYKKIQRIDRGILTLTTYQKKLFEILNSSPGEKLEQETLDELNQVQDKILEMNKKRLKVEAKL